MDIAPALLVGHGIGYHEALLAARRRLDPVSRMVLVSGAPWYTGDLDIEGRYSRAFSRWEDNKRYPEREGSVYKNREKKFDFATC